MVVSIVAILVTPPLCRRYGPTPAIIGLTVSALLFAAGGTWATPNLSPLTALLTMVPLLVGFPYLTQAVDPRPHGHRRGRQRLGGRAGRVASRRQRQRHLVGQRRGHRRRRCRPASLVVVFLVRDAYTRLRDQSVQLAESRTRIVEVADAARRGLERDLHDGAQQRLLAMSVTIERARKELLAGRHEEARRP